MTQTPLYLVPGICKVDSNYSLGQPFNFVSGRYAKGRWADGNFYRFTAGFPEKIGGWQSFLSSGLIGIPRAQQPWLDYDYNIEIGVGTESHLYAYTNGSLIDITPKNLIVNGTLTNPFSTTLNSTTVAVADNSQALQNNDWIFLSAESTVGGLTINGYYIVSNASPTGFDITTQVPATSTTSGVGGTTEYEFPRYNLTNPFATVSGSSMVTVTDPSHQAATGDYVTNSGASTFHGVNLNGQFQVTVINANSYTIIAPNAATGTGSGGGTVSVVHNISLVQETSSATTPYGTGPYGFGPYGYGTIATQVPQPNWSLAEYGNLLLASPVGGTIYMYDPSQGGVAFPLLNSPTNVLGMFVTSERYVIALGTNASRLQIAWPNQSDPTNWTASVTSTANATTLQGGSRFIGGLSVTNGLSLAWSDRCLFAMNYTGSGNYYNLPLVADNAGLVGPHAAVAEGGVAFWMSDKDFWTYNGGAAEALPSDDVRDSVFNQSYTSSMNLLYTFKACCGMNRAKREVWFFYVSQQSTEIDTYVIYHIDQQCFSTGRLSRTTWVDSKLLPAPIASDATGILYNHEIGVDANGSPMDSWIQTGPIDLSNGDTSMDVMGCIPDFERLSGTVNMTVLTRQYPQDADTSNGPYPITQGDVDPLVDLRLDGRLMAAVFSSDQLGGDYRLGLMRFDLKPSGARR